MISTIVLSEPRMTKNAHVLFNSGVIVQLIKSKDINILFISEKTHFENVINEIDKSGVNKIKSLKFNGNRFSRIKIFFYSIFISFKTNSKLVFLSITPFQLFFLHFFSFFTNKRITFFAHGDFGVLTKKKRGIKGGVFNLFLIFFLKTRRNNLQIIFVGETVFVKINEIISNLDKKSIFHIEHPITEKNIKAEKETNNCTIVLGSIGTALKIKNSESIFSIAKEISNSDKNNIFQFRHVGSISNEILNYSNSFVKYNNSQFLLSDSSYYRELIQLDYILVFLRDGDYYDLCPSGTFTEIIRFEKPVICLKSSVSKFYFDKYGDIGYMFDDLTEMKNGILNLNKPECIKRYSIQKSNLSNAKNKLLLNFDLLDLITKL